VALVGDSPINLASITGDFVVGLASPTPARPVVELARLSIMVMSAGPGGFSIHPSNMSSSNVPIYADGADYGNLIQMTPRTFGGDGLVTGINQPDCFPEEASWGRVKLIYD
jgi:hypothetical protein